MNAPTSIFKYKDQNAATQQLAATIFMITRSCANLSNWST